MTVDSSVHLHEALAESYRLCAGIARRHGKTYSAAARLLAPAGRRHVHAVYAFCRVADDLVDDLAEQSVETRREALDRYAARFRDDLAAGRSDDPVLAAVVTTAASVGIPPSCFERFLSSMAMDLTVSTHGTWDDLCGYMDGSAAVIGEMMLPVLGGSGRRATDAARALGLAFQMTNFLRDVGEDLDRGRVYLPQDDLQRFGADPWSRRVTPQWRDLMRFQIARTRSLYQQADDGIGLLPPRSARCVWAARVLYSRILTRIEAHDYDVFSRRAVTPARQKALVAAQALVRPAPKTS